MSFDPIRQTIRIIPAYCWWQSIQAGATVTDAWIIMAAFAIPTWGGIYLYDKIKSKAKT